jgi:hypothetical protein
MTIELAPEGTFAGTELVSLDLPLSLDQLRAAAAAIARVELSDAVTEALHADGRSLRQIERDTGLDPAFLSRLANGEKGATVTSLALVALALGKTLSIEIA